MYEAVFSVVLNDLIGHVNFKETLLIIIHVCVITVNRYSDYNAQS